MPPRHGIIQTIARLLAVLLAVLALEASAGARDVFVVLSGGVSAGENNLSQYLQARAMVNFFQTRHPREPLWVFFGAGNVEGRPPVFGDVRRETRQGDLAIDSWLPGALPHNLPARRDVILRALREEILPAVADGGTLFLFVGDHGSLAPGDNGEGLIDLWGYERDPKSEHGWRLQEQTLGVEELRRTLLHGMGRGRLVFCMTQCTRAAFITWESRAR